MMGTKELKKPASLQVLASRHPLVLQMPSRLPEVADAVQRLVQVAP